MYARRDAGCRPSVVTMTKAAGVSHVEDLIDDTRAIADYTPQGLSTECSTTAGSPTLRRIVVGLSLGYRDVQL